jgi:hypothetical protein
MPNHKRIRAVRRVISLVEGLIAAFDEVADELAQMQDEVADAALAMLHQWAKDAEANDDGDAGDRGARRMRLAFAKLVHQVDPL